jgi:hypothetical protein
MNEEVSKSVVDMRMALARLTSVNSGEGRTKELSVAITELETALLWVQSHQILEATKGAG